MTKIPYEWNLNHQRRAQMWKQWSIIWFVIAIGEAIALAICLTQ